MPVTKFVLDSKGMKQMLNEDWLRDHLTDRAGRVRDAASAGGPDYSYEVEQVTTDRAVVRVGSSDDGVLFFESATGNLLRALDAAG